jgi:hypothetical protein
LTAKKKRRNREPLTPQLLPKQRRVSRHPTPGQTIRAITASPILELNHVQATHPTNKTIRIVALENKQKRPSKRNDKDRQMRMRQHV